MYFQELEVEIQCWTNDLDCNEMSLARAQETLEIVSSLIAKLVAVIPNETEKRATFNIPPEWSATPLAVLKKSLENHISAALIFPVVSFDALMSARALENDGIDLSEALEDFVARADVKTPQHVDSDWIKKSQENVAQFLRASGDMPKPKEVEKKEKAEVEESYDDDFFLYSSGEEEESEEEYIEDEKDSSGDEA